jgi:hypothetical protein
LIDRGRIGGLFALSGLALLCDNANVARELIALVVELLFRGSGGIEAGGGRPEERESVLNGIQADLPA